MTSENERTDAGPETAAVDQQLIVHTPGPWERYGHIGQSGLMRVRACTGADRVGRKQFVDVPATAADAKLIAAAPDLLEAIKRIQHFITGGCDMPINRRLKCIEMECEASIAKVL